MSWWNNKNRWVLLSKVTWSKWPLLSFLANQQDFITHACYSSFISFMLIHYSNAKQNCILLRSACNVCFTDQDNISEKNANIVFQHFMAELCSCFCSVNNMYTVILPSLLYVVPITHFRWTHCFSWIFIAICRLWASSFCIEFFFVFLFLFSRVRWWPVVVLGYSLNIFTVAM